MVFPRQAYHKVLVVTQILMKPPLSGRRKGQSMEKLSNPQVTIETIKKYEFAFQKKFGQNFLIDSHVINKIISAADITKDDCVLEIGPGIGTMTQYLAESAGQVVAVEIDKNLLPILDETLAEYDNVTVINDDILKVDINKIVEERNGGRPIKVVANLPYYITTPIIMGLFEKHVPLLSVTVMVQKEVADRMQSDREQRITVHCHWQYSITQSLISLQMYHQTVLSQDREWGLPLSGLPDSKSRR